MDGAETEAFQAFLAVLAVEERKITVPSKYSVKTNKQNNVTI